MEHHRYSKAGEANAIVEAIFYVTTAQKRRKDLAKLECEAREKIQKLYPGIHESQMEDKWKEIEETAQLFREAFHSGNDPCRNTRIIDLVWQGVKHNQVDADRDREDNESYTGGHLKHLQKRGIEPKDYDTKDAELREYLKTAPEADWQFDQAIYNANLALNA